MCVYTHLMEILVGPCVWVNLLDMDVSRATLMICDGVVESLIDGVVESLFDGVVVGVACCLICAVRWVHRMGSRLLIQGVFVSWCSLVCYLIRP